MSYEYSYILEEILESGALAGLVSGVPSMLLSVATYVLSALALYTVASRRGIRNPWMAWIPVLNVWLLGSLSDQYRYVVKGQEKNKRKTLLILNIINMVLGIAVVVFLILMAVAAIRSEMSYFARGYESLMNEILRYAIALGCTGMIMLGTGIAAAVVRYIALYDVYTSMDPSNCVLFLVLSIIFKITEPFFLFFNRNNDKGMPPRREAPTYVPPVEPWENHNENY